MKAFFYTLFFSFLLSSCTKPIQVEEYCRAKSIIDGEYIEYSELLALVEDNDSTGMLLDTMYFKVEKDTEHRFKLQGKAAFDALQDRGDLKLEYYVYLSPKNEHEKAWGSTAILHKLPKHTDWIPTICQEDISDEFLSLLEASLKDKGYRTEGNAGQSSEGLLMDLLVQYQKAEGLPFGHFDISSLNHLGVRVVESK